MQFERKSSLRLKDFDYSQPGAYFVTICTVQRLCLFGEIIHDQMVPNPSGKILQHAWRALPTHYPHAKMDAFVVMPNHVHGIIMLLENDVLINRRDRFINLSLPNLYLRKNQYYKRQGLSEIVRGFKTWTARRINEMQNTTGTPVWQRSFYDHIIRDEDDLNRIREYVMSNPLMWEDDRNNPRFY
jgi:putative transposase